MAASDLHDFLAGDGAAPAGAEHSVGGDAADTPRPAENLAATATFGVGNRFEIHPDQPIADLDTVTANAYAAHDRRDPRAMAFALVCHGAMPPRADAANVLRGIENPSLLKLLDFAVVPWPADGVERVAMVFEQPRGSRLTASHTVPTQPMGEDALVRLIFQPAVQALRELKMRRVVHGHINPTNLFLGDEAGKGVVLGECVSMPPGFAQPAVFEPVERGMALPAGRGAGSQLDDLYALGVTVLYLTTGQDPAAGQDDRAITAAKLEHGSYKALAEGRRIPANLIEPLRGLLMDDPGERWSLDDLELWLNGRRLTPKQSRPAKRAVRPLDFTGRMLWTAPALAGAMADRPAEAGDLIERGHLQGWLRHGLEDTDLAELVGEAIEGARPGPAGSEADRRLARVLMALYPPAPIRYRGQSLAPEAMGNALLHAVTTGGHVQETAEIIAAQLPLFWINVQHGFKPDFVALVKTFEKVRSFLGRSGLGYGLERCLYELNPAMPCMSPILEGRYVQDLAGLMGSLEEIAKRPDRPQHPIDRHILAFAPTRGARVPDRLLVQAASETDPVERILATLDILGDLQVRAKTERLPALCGWMATYVGPAVDRFKSRTLRGKVREELAKQADMGDLSRLAGLLHNVKLLQRDAMGFRRAQHEYQVIGRAIQGLQDKLKRPEALVTGIGRQAAAVTASGLAALALVGIVLASGL